LPSLALALLLGGVLAALLAEVLPAYWALL